MVLGTDAFRIFGISLCIVICVLISETTSRNSNSTSLERTARKNYNFYQPQPPKDYGDDSDDSDDDDEQNPGKSKPSQGSYFPGFGKYKGYNPYSNYDMPMPMYPPFAPNFKGDYPMFPPVASLNPNKQMMQMMAALSNMDSSSKHESGGFLSKLFADPNTATAAIIPLSIITAAVVPVLMNYLMSSPPTPMVSTVANSKEARNLEAFKDLEIVMVNFSRFAKTMDGDECIQKTICRIASGAANMPVTDYIRKAVGEISTHFTKDNWKDSLGIKRIIDGVKQGNCANVCSGSKAIPKQR
ncbi:hypothetical protein HNY73_022044 [Argiope bruennichi]|uniref:Uncharacterized protein n=1 Tax=Argiope bruennichi TaxID=94029 RepID=A0A8T0E3S8_ARGBR|nr:hypothetical protein HNY73_022044 [Argiope bruennichi]